MEHSDIALERARLNAQTARIGWKELQRFFAAGKVVYIAPELDLVDVALAINHDRSDSLQRWMAARQVQRVSDAQAREWVEVNALMWCVVVKPWVLVQPVLENANRSECNDRT